MAVKPPTRRWLQFGLGSLLGLVLLAALFLGYTAWWMNRLAEVERRNEALVKELQEQQQLNEDLLFIQRLEEIRIQGVTAGTPAPDGGTSR